MHRGYGAHRDGLKCMSASGICLCHIIRCCVGCHEGSQRKYLRQHWSETHTSLGASSDGFKFSIDCSYCECSCCDAVVRWSNYQLRPRRKAAPPQEALAVRRSWLAASHQQAAAVLAMARAFASLERSSQVHAQLPALDCVLRMGAPGLPLWLSPTSCISNQVLSGMQICFLNCESGGMSNLYGMLPMRC